MKLRYNLYTLHLQYGFTIATNFRKTTPIILTEITHKGLTGYGEASVPSYLGESQTSVANFLSRVNLEQFNDPFEIEKILTYIDEIEHGHNAAKASVDIALHDLIGKLIDKPLYKLWGFTKTNTPYTSFTIGIDNPEMVRKKAKEATQFKILKVKLGSKNDKEIINAIHSVAPDKPLYVDVNQGWKDKYFALDMVHWLKEKNVKIIEQPLPVKQLDDMAWLTEKSPIPTIADESVKRLSDIMHTYGAFSGINIKLMKSSGMREAHKMINLGKALGLKVMLGCMTETSCAISAASHLSPIVDYADLDGALLITNDTFIGTEIIHGKITLNNKPGIGVYKI